MYIPATDNVVKGYEITNSLRFNDNDSAYLSRTPASAGNRNTWTWAGWVKRGDIGIITGLFGAGTAGNNWSGVYFNNDNLYFKTEDSGTVKADVYTNALFRDIAAAYHIVVRFDSTEAASADRIKIYVNGELRTLTTNTTVSGTSNDHKINAAITSSVGAVKRSSYDFKFDGYLADVHFIDGQALGPENFGETGTYGEWKPIQYTGTYGTNGFYLDFETSGDLGNDVSGNGNDWTPTNLSATDQMLDTPSNNFATYNPLAIRRAVTPAATFSEGNLRSSHPNAGGNQTWACGSISQDAGKYYFEVNVETTGSNTNIGIGTQVDIDTSANGFIGYRQNGDISKYGVSQTTAATYTNGDIIGVAYDLTGATVDFYKNGAHQYQVTSISAFTYIPFVKATTGEATRGNFGQDSSFAGNKTPQGYTDANGRGDFYYAPPSGYLALCTANLSDPTVVPSEHFNTVLYTGDGASSHSITGVGFQPDWIWLKQRVSPVEDHYLMDVVRGASKHLSSNTTGGEDTNTNVHKTFDADGFTVGPSAVINTSGKTYVSWNWKANGSGVSNTDGSITSTVSANVDAGFSIVSYTGTGNAETVGHGLTEAPELVIYKDRDLATSWGVGCDSIGWTKYLHLDLANAEAVGARFNNTAPTASVFSIGAGFHTNGNNHIAYAFHSVDGFSKFGSYTGNGSTDGPFVYCGFRPAYVMVKRTSAVGSWVVMDSDRNTYNIVDGTLYANSSSAESSNDLVDFTSNGFKLRNAFTDLNSPSGQTYIFMAFAESPFSNTNAR